MLAHRLRPRPSVNPTFSQRLLLPGMAGASTRAVYRHRIVREFNPSLLLTGL